MGTFLKSFDKAVFCLANGVYFKHLTAKGMRRFRHFLYSFPIPNGAIVRTRMDPALWIGVVDTSHIPVPLRTE